MLRPLLKREHREANLELSWKPLLANEHSRSREELCRQRNNNGLIRCGPWSVLVTFYITVIKVPDRGNLMEKRPFSLWFWKVHSSWRRSHGMAT